MNAGWIEGVGDGRTLRRRALGAALFRLYCSGCLVPRKVDALSRDREI